jgi:hypothetical protein
MADSYEEILMLFWLSSLLKFDAVHYAEGGIKGSANVSAPIGDIWFFDDIGGECRFMKIRESEWRKQRKSRAMAATRSSTSSDLVKQGDDEASAKNSSK